MMKTSVHKDTGRGEEGSKAQTAQRTETKGRILAIGSEYKLWATEFREL